MKSKTTVKILKITGITLGAIVLILLGVLIYIDQHAEKIVEDILAKKWKGSELSKVYDLEYGNIRLGLFSGNLIIKDFKLRPSESFYKSSDTLRFKYPLVYNVQVPKFTISGISDNLSLELTEIQLEEIEFVRPAITMVSHLSKAERNESRQLIKKLNKPGKTKETQLDIQQLSLLHFSIYKGSFSYYDKVQKSELAKAESINIAIDTLKLTPGHLIKTLITRTFTSAYISLGDISYPIPGGFYKIKVKEIQNNVGDRIIIVNDFELQAQYGKMDFGKKFGKQTSWMNLKVEELEIDDLDLKKLLLENTLFIDNLIVDEAGLKIFRDKNIPFDFTVFPPLPQVALSNIDMGLDIRKVQIKNSSIYFEMLTQNSEKSGNVPISELNATIYNVSNIPEVINKIGPMKWDAQGTLFNDAKLKLEVLFPKNIHNPDFSFWGELAATDMTAFNSILDNTYHVRIDQGNLKSISFKVNANDDYSEGDFVMAYDSLKIAVLKKITDKEKQEHGFFSSIANTVARKSNPGKKNLGEAPEPAKIFFVRDKNKAIFHYMIGSLISGVRETIVPGVGMDKKKYEKKQVKDEEKDARVHKKEEHKEGKLSKKEARKQKREEKKKNRK